MGLIRRHLGVWTLAWITCQVTSLSLPLPFWHALASTTGECLVTAADDACPMRDADGQACPMHDGTNRPGAVEQCAMRALSHGPSVALATIFSIPAVLMSEIGIAADTQSAMLNPFVAHAHGAPLPVDSPPPRS